MAKIYKVTMADIAKRAGVSRMTVSLALRDQPKFSEAASANASVHAIGRQGDGRGIDAVRPSS